MHDYSSDSISVRRRALLRALAAGGLGATGLPTATAQLFGQVPDKLPAGRSIYRLRGDVLVDGTTATVDTTVTADSTVQTGRNGRIMFVVGTEAFLLRANSRMQLTSERSGALTRSLRLLSGKLLSVFGSNRFRAETPMATIGIRGTGVYLESDDKKTYVCTCYGSTRITAVDNPDVTEEISTRHHDAPRYVYADGETSSRIQTAPFINHTDDELALIEALVGRTPPFSVPGGYSAPRRDY